MQPFLIHEGGDDGWPRGWQDHQAVEWVGQVVATLSTEPITNKQLYNNREAFTDADNFGISFPLDLDVKVIPVVTLRMSNIFFIYSY